MRRFHRRLHLWLWMLLAPLCLVGVAAALATRPVTPDNDLPPAIAAERP
jgi:hypothetical protein